jgi:hypothetical protein
MQCMGRGTILYTLARGSRGGGKERALAQSHAWSMHCAAAHDCPRREPPFRPSACPSKSGAQNRFAVENAEGPSPPRVRARTVGTTK